MTETSAQIRTAEPRDAAALGRVHVRAWQATYRGMMPDAFLDGLDAVERGAMWARGLAATSPESARFVVCVPSQDDPVGFAVVGPVRDGGADGSELGELYAINLDPDVWGRGLGRRLLHAATAGLSRLGFREAVLWVVTGNSRARRFYEEAGWSADGTERTDESFGPPIEEVRYRRRLPLETRNSTVDHRIELGYWPLDHDKSR